MNNVKQELASIADQINKLLNELLESELSSKKNLYGKIIDDITQNSLLLPLAGGKRLRGSFVIQSYKMFHGKDVDEILYIAAAMELIHAYLLIHDDAMDKADFRRDSKTIHKVFEKLYTESNGKQDAFHFGISQAINIGDILNHLATLIFLRTKFKDDLKVKALQIAQRNFIEVGYGQVMDVYSEIIPIDEEYVMDIYKHKTGIYTYENPLLMGAIFAEAPKESYEILKKYALPGGIAYQIVDDVLDIFGSQNQTGKPLGQDIKEGKRTLLRIEMLKNANKSEQSYIHSLTGKASLSNVDLENFKEIAVSTGAYTRVMQIAQNLLEESSSEISALKNIDKNALQFFIDINNYMSKRVR